MHQRQELQWIDRTVEHSIFRSVFMDSRFSTRQTLLRTWALLKSDIFAALATTSAAVVLVVVVVVVVVAVVVVL
jgi:hypothetical protein